MGADSHPSIPASSNLEQSELINQKPERVFQTEIFDIYVARIVRKAIVEQYVEQEHQVLVDELRLIRESMVMVRDHLAATASEWQLPWRLTKMIVIRHLHELSIQRLELHEVEDEARNVALRTVMQLDFEEIFPKDWMDS